MKNIYEKSELTFSLLWIIVYIVAMSLGDYFSSLIGIEKIFTTPIVLFFVISILIWIRKSVKSKKYGLVKGTFPQKTYLYFIPLISTVSINFWGGVDLQYSAVETILYIASMLCVGFVEEIIFRGFLFKALSAVSLNQPLIDRIVFGLFHLFFVFLLLLHCLFVFLLINAFVHDVAECSRVYLCVGIFDPHAPV